MKKSMSSENAKFPKCNITVMIDDVNITINPPFIHIGSSRPSRATIAWLGTPSLCGGLRAEHLTIPLEPMSHGPHAGKLNVHLTYKVGSRSIHKTIAFIEPAALTAKLESFADQLIRYHLRHTRRVSLDELQREGYVVTLLDEDSKRKLESLFHKRRSKHRLNDSTLATLVDHLEVYELEILDQLREDSPTTPVFLMRESDGRAGGALSRRRGEANRQALGPTKPATCGRCTGSPASARSGIAGMCVYVLSDLVSAQRANCAVAAHGPVCLPDARARLSQHG